MRKKLTATQKAHNARIYKQIRKQYNKIADKNVMTYVEYKNEVFLRANADKINVKQAAIKLNNTELFVTRAERSRTNLINSLKKEHNYVFKKLKQLSRNEKGQFVAMSNNLVWDRDLDGYILSGRYLIEVSNSPEEVNVFDLETQTYVD